MRVGWKRSGGLLQAARSGDPLATYITQHAPLPVLVPVSLYFAHVNEALLYGGLSWLVGALCFQVPWIRFLKFGTHPPTGTAQTIAAATSTSAMFFSPEIWLVVVAFCSMGIALALVSNKRGSAVFQLACTVLATYLGWRSGQLVAAPSWVLVGLVIPMAFAAIAFVSSDLAWADRRLSSSLAGRGTTAWDIDATGRVVQVLGVPLAGVAVGTRLSDVIHPNDDRPAAPEPGDTMEYRVACPDQGWRWIREHIEAESPGPRTRRSGVLDISEARESSELMRERALIDELTALPNRSSHLALSARWADQGTGFLVLIDLDNFKNINDTLGHNAGDQVLETVARRFVGVAGPDQVARLGGDEFAALVDGNADHVRHTAQRLAATLVESISVGDMLISAGASVGVAAFESGVGADEVRRRAGVALRAAKGSTVDLVVYDETLERRSVMRHDLASNLPTALAGGELIVFHQIKVDLTTGHPTGTEALVRWQHPTYGTVTPDEFLDLVAVGGHHRVLFDVVLRAALGDLTALIERAGDDRLTVSVNVHPHNIREGDLVERVVRALDRAGLSPRHLVLELTEQALVTDDERAASTMRRLRELGVRLSVDDFGAGYSALGYLARLPIAEVKLDRSLVAKISESPRDRAVAEAVLGLAERLDLTVVAEGVEDLETLNCLAAMNCAVAQGYFLGRPVPLDDVDLAVVDGLRLPTLAR